MKKRLMTIFVIVAVLLTLLPATLVVNAADEWTNVSNFQQLKSALASTTVTKVRFTNNISVAKCGAVISEKKSSLVIDGNGYTLTDYYSNSANDTIRLVTAGKLINIDIQNMNIQGWNAYGPFYIRDACNIVGRNLYFDNVIYEGPQLAINHRGNVEIKDSDINLRQGYCKTLGSVAACITPI